MAVAAAIAATALFMKPPLHRADPAWPFHLDTAVLRSVIDSLGGVLADTLTVSSSVIGDGFLAGALHEVGINGSCYLSCCAVLQESLQWRVQHAGDTIEAVWNRGRLAELRAYPRGVRGFYRVELTSEGAFSSWEFVREEQWLRTRQVACTVESTVWESLWDSALPPDLCPEGAVVTSRDSSRAWAYVSELQHELTDRLFAYDIDFYHDVRVGDRVWILLEEVRYPGTGETGFRRILAAKYEFAAGGIAEALPFYRVPEGSTDGVAVLEFFHRDGASLKTMFLRMPVPFGRVTSAFSSSRMHPVLGYSRAHTGIDYGAPSGTEIWAVGDGVITLRQYQGGYGNMVRIRHANGYETGYGHMSGFAQGQSTGSYVRQGEVIGYVGSTGLSTGPHVHFEMKRNGTYINPATEIVPPVDPLEGEDLAAFQAGLPIMEAVWDRMAGSPIPRAEEGEGSRPAPEPGDGT
jgi:murein DD-endopeptidase MepM/ murein hydrolase activator NlpD